MRTALDRAAAVRRALVRLVARHGFHGASMGAVAAEAGVATGTAYVHYASKEELVHATYLEVKHDLMAAAFDRIDPHAAPRERFGQLWHGGYDYLAEQPDRARFLVQVDGSPFAGAAHRKAMAADGDPLVALPAVAELVAQFVALPHPLLYDLSIGPVVRLVASGQPLARSEVPLLIEACWRAVTA